MKDLYTRLFLDGALRRGVPLPVAKAQVAAVKAAFPHPMDDKTGFEATDAERGLRKAKPKTPRRPKPSKRVAS